MADYIPPEYQAQLERLKRQQAFAQALQAGSMRAQPTEVITGHAVRQGPLSHGLRALTALMANKSVGEADAGIGALNQEMATKRQAAIAAMLAQGQKDPTQAIMAGQSSMDPRMQAIATAMQAQREKRLEGFSNAVKDSNPEAAAQAFQTGELPSAAYQQPDMPAPTFGTDPAGNAYAVTGNRKGEKEIKYAPKETKVTNTVDARQSKTAYETIEPNLKIRQAEATSARDALRANGRAMDALNQYAQAGGGQDIKQLLRKGLQAFGVNSPETADTEQLGMALGENLLANARKLAPVTENDMAQLKNILGSISTDPTALQKALEFTNSIALKSMQDYQGYVNEAAAPLKNPEEQGLFKAQLKGYELPNIPGNQEQQFRQLAELQKQGGDITQFRDPTGQQFSPDARFSIAPARPREVNKPSASTTGLTPQEAARLDELRKKFGRR